MAHRRGKARFRGGLGRFLSRSWARAALGGSLIVAPGLLVEIVR